MLQKTQLISDYREIGQKLYITQNKPFADCAGPQGGNERNKKNGGICQDVNENKGQEKAVFVYARMFMKTRQLGDGHNVRKQEFFEFLRILCLETQFLV
jgi:hypothetical protein